MALLLELDLFSAVSPTSNFAPLAIDAQGQAYLAFDTTTSENVAWQREMPAFTGPLTLKVKYRAASATSGTFTPTAAFEAITPGDALNTGTTSSFDTANSASADTVPGTAGYMKEVSITLTNADSVAAGDAIRIRLARDVANDNAAGDIQVMRVALYDAA